MSWRKEKGGGAMSLRTFARIFSAFSAPTDAVSISWAFSIPPRAMRLLRFLDVPELFEDLGGFPLLDALGSGDLPGDAFYFLGGHVLQDPRGLVFPEEHEKLGGLAVPRIAAGLLDEAADGGVGDPLLSCLLPFWTAPFLATRH